MPPVTKAGGTQFRKDVEFTATKDSDEYELEAAGIVMVPDKADLQNDFAREETIREFAEQFEDFEEAGQAGGGIMHAAWPDGWMELERNEVLDEAEEIGGQTVEAGAWVQRWGIDNPQLAFGIDDGILEGYSIGAIQVEWDGPYEPEEVDDVDTSEIPDGEMVWELVAGIIREVSAVDIPAVPDAQIVEAKSLEKRLADYVGDQDGFIEAAMDRGHTEDEAEFLWDLLNAAVEADGSSDPGKQSRWAQAGKAFFETLMPGSDDGTEAKTSPEAPDADAAKEGRTLSRSNEKRQMAVIDAALDTLQDAGVDHGMTRFTDRDSVDFDLSEHSAREWVDSGEDEEEEDEEEAGKDAPAGDTADDNSTDMSDDDSPDDGGPDPLELAEQNAEQITDLTQAVENLTESLAGPEPKTAEIEIEGETYEVREEAAKAALGVDENQSVADAIEALNEKASRVDEVENRLDTIVQQSGAGSQQVDAAAEGDDEETGGMDAIKEALS